MGWFSKDKEKNGPTTSSFKIQVNIPNKSEKEVNVEVVDENTNEVLASHSVETPKVQSSKEVKLKKKLDVQQAPATPQPTPNPMELELMSIKNMLSSYGLEKLQEEQTKLTQKNNELSNQIQARQELLAKLEKEMQTIEDEAVDSYRKRLQALNLNYISTYMNKHS